MNGNAGKKHIMRGAMCAPTDYVKLNYCFEI
jgi:hypothetical protein